MKAVDQTIISGTRGDCHRATIASILELELEQVPHFKLFSDSRWFDVFYYFMLSMGWGYVGYTKHWWRGKESFLKIEESIGGFFNAGVKSKTLKNKFHSVVIDMRGMVVHDPNPNKKWLGINIIETRQARGWYKFKPATNYRKEAT